MTILARRPKGNYKVSAYSRLQDSMEQPNAKGANANEKVWELGSHTEENEPKYHSERTQEQNAFGLSEKGTETEGRRVESFFDSFHKINNTKTAL